MQQERWLTIPEAAAFYGISENATRQRMKRRHFEGCEKREGLWYIRVESDQPPITSLTTTDQPQLAAIERLVAAQEETNRLLAQLLEQTKQPPARGRQKWKWPWQQSSR